MKRADLRISVSFIKTFKACAMRCYYKYIHNISPEGDTDSQRIGTHWHKCLEIVSMKTGSVCPDCADQGKKDPDCVLCQGTDLLPDNMMDAVIRYLNKSYEKMPAGKTADEWETERTIILYSLCGYVWYYQDKEKYTTVAREIPFSLPIRNPGSGRRLIGVQLDGKIDKLAAAPDCAVVIYEHKSTGSSIDEDSDFWKHLTLDTQGRVYPYSARELQLMGALEIYDIKPGDPLISSVVYDVWHKPGIRPAKLTQGETKEFVATGEYKGQKFEVSVSYDGVFVNGVRAEVTPGAKEGTFAIRETASMFGARLLADIVERPTFYFARRTVGRTDEDIRNIQTEIVNIYHTVRFLEKNNCWWCDETQCEATFKCPYISICYNNVKLKSDEVPPGFRRTYVLETERGE